MKSNEQGSHFLGQTLNSISPGLILVAVVAIVSRFLHGSIIDPTWSRTINEILIAVLLGLIICNGIGHRGRSEAGIKFSIDNILRLGIILLGLRLSLQAIVATGMNALVLIGICITVTLTLSYLAGRFFRVPTRLVILIGIGTAICGNSAIIATAPVIEAKEEEVSFAVATITLFGLLAVITYPLIGNLLGLSDQDFGLWAGTAINDTSQVVAAGAAFSEAALSVATVVKLTRNTLMAPQIVLLGIVYSRGVDHKVSDKAAKASRLSLGKLIPGFVLGFLLMSLIRTAGIAVGILPQYVSQPGNLIRAANILKMLDGMAKFSILMALAGVGLNTDLSKLNRIGIKSLIVGTSVALVLAMLSLSIIMFTPIGG